MGTAGCSTCQACNRSGGVRRSLLRVPNRAPAFSPDDGEDERPRLRRVSDVAVVETTDEGQGDDAAVHRRLDRARLGRILLEGEMSARAVVVAEVGSETTTKVSLVEDNHVVEKLTADGANHALGEGVLPGRAGRSENLGQAHALHSSLELASVDGVAIAQ